MQTYLSTYSLVVTLLAVYYLPIYYFIKRLPFPTHSIVSAKLMFLRRMSDIFD